MEYYVLHSFKEEMYIPISAISPNIDFLLDKGERTIKTKDGVTAKVISSESVHILSDKAKDIIKRVYGIDDVYAFMKKWYGALKYIHSMEFFYLKLEKL